MSHTCATVDFSFCCSQLATAVAAPQTTETMSNDDPSLEDSPRNEGGEDGNEPVENAEDALDAILRDLSKKAALLRKMGLDDIQGTPTGEPSYILHP